MALAVEAGDNQNPVLLNLEDDSVWKPAHSGTTTCAMNNGELLRTSGDCVHRFLDRRGKAISELRAYGVVPVARVYRLGFRLR